MSKKTIVAIGLASVAGLAAVVHLATPAAGTCIPSDNVDDRACLQAELDDRCSAGGGTLHLAPGVWNLVRGPGKGTGHRDNAGLWVECSDLTLEGAGPETVLMMTGDGLGADQAAIRVAPRVAGLAVERVVIQDLTVASDLLANPNEQTHLVYLGPIPQVQAGIVGTTIRRVTLRHPVRPEVAGDCLRFVGEQANPIRDTDVGDVTFEACDRSGIAVQRASEGFRFHDLRFKDIGKTAIDLEPSGLGPIRDGVLERLQVDEGGVSLCGRGEEGQSATGLAVRDSTIHGGLGTIYASGVELERVTIDAVRDDDRGALNLRASDHIEVRQSTIRRLGGSVPGPAVRLVGHNGRFTNLVELEANVIASDVSGDVIAVESAQDVTVEKNRISGPAGAYGVFARPTGQDVDGVRVASNRFVGPLAGAVRLSGGPLLIRAVQLLGNTGPSVGLRCENPPKFAQAVVQGGGYLYGGAATAGCAGVAVVAQYP